MRTPFSLALALGAAALAAATAIAAPPPALQASAGQAQQTTPPLTPDIPARFDAPTSGYDYVKRDVMVPMRDGVKLHTVIVVPQIGRAHV